MRTIYPANALVKCLRVNSVLFSLPQARRSAPQTARTHTPTARLKHAHAAIMREVRAPQDLPPDASAVPIGPRQIIQRLHGAYTLSTQNADGAGRWPAAGSNRRAISLRAHWPAVAVVSPRRFGAQRSAADAQASEHKSRHRPPIPQESGKCLRMCWLTLSSQSSGDSLAPQRGVTL